MSSSKSASPSPDTALPPRTRSRLPTYVRIFEELAQGGHRIASSLVVARQANVSDTIVKRDLGRLDGQLGCVGIGYNVEYAIYRLRATLGLPTRPISIILGGDGPLAVALSDGETLLPDYDFKVVATVELSLKKAAENAGRVLIPRADIERAVKENDVNCAVVCTAPAQTYVDDFAAAGVSSMICCVAENVNVPDGVNFANLGLADRIRAIFTAT